MSDIGGGNTGMQAAAIEAVVGADTSPMQTAIEHATQDMTTKVDAAAKASSNSVQNMSNRMGQSLSGFRQTLSSVSLSLGQNTPLAPLVLALSGVESGLKRIPPAEDQATTGMEKFSRTSTLIFGLSTALLGVGGALSRMSAPLQQAQAGLSVAISNTTDKVTGQQNAIEDYQSQISDATKVAQGYGYVQSDLQNALAKLTVQTKDPTEAIKELTFTETLASASGVTLGRAADMVGRMHAGQFRYLRQFGIDIQNVKVSQLDAAKASEQLAAAQQKLQTAQENLNNFEQRMQQQKADAQAKMAQQVQDAQGKMEDAQSHYDAVVQEQSDRETAKAQQYADAVTSASDAVAKAQQDLADLQAVNSARRIDELQRQQEEEEAAAQAAHEAAQSVADIMHDMATRPAKNAQEAENYQRALRDAQEKSAQANEKQNDVMTKSLETNEQQLRQSQEMRDKQAALADAQQKVVKAQKDQRDNSLAIASGAETVRRAQEALNNATEKYNRLKEEQAHAGDMTLAQKQQEIKLYEAEDKAAHDVLDKQNKLKDAKNQQAALDAAFQDAENQFMQREQGLLDKRKNTWAGHWAQLKAMVINWFQDMGDTLGGLMMTAGGIGMAAGGLGKVVSGVGSGFKKILGRGKGGGAGGGIVEKAEGDVEEALEGGGPAFPGASVGRGTGGKFTSLKTVADDVEEAEGKIGKSSGGIVNSIKGIWGALKNRGAMEGDGGFMNVAGIAEKLGGAFGGAKAKVIESISGMMPMLEGLGATMLEFAGPIAIIAGIGLVAYEIYEHWDTIKEWLGKIWDWIKSTATKIFGGLVDFFKKWGLTIIELLTPVGWIALIIQHWSAIKDKVVEIVSKLIDFAKDWGVKIIEIMTGAWMIVMIVQHWSDIKDAIVNFFKDSIKWLENAGKDLLGGLWNGIRGAISWWWNMVVGFATDIMNLAGIEKKAIEWLVDAGKDLVSGLWNGVLSMADWFWDKVSGFFKDVWHKVTHFWESLSPSRKTARLGTYIVQGLGMGVDQEAPNFHAKVQSMSQKAADILSATGRKVRFGGIGLPGIGLPGGIGTSGQPIMVLNQTVQGSVVTERELMDKTRGYFINQGGKNGGVGKYLGVSP